VKKTDYPADWPGHEELDTLPDAAWRTGGSAIVDPYGNYVAGPLGDEEGILYGDLDLGEVARAKFDLDVVGHYARPDVFQLRVNTIRPTSP
jgi:nitrilase